MDHGGKSAAEGSGDRSFLHVANQLRSPPVHIEYL
jgi:hypothetical protein